ncbi:MAG: NAD(P)/FAD-dependent oxidoreductase [Pseudomonadota bacterium]
MPDAVDCIVIGAGVVGLACAARLAEAGRDVIVLEQHDLIGSETSSRNSEVIHAGIYYPSGSEKAALCVEGKHRLYEYCERYQVPHRNCGKVIVAVTDEQIEVLEGYKQQAAANGVTDLQWLDAAQLAELEPAVQGVGALLSPSTGIIDSHSLMLSLQGRLEAAGGMIAFGSRVTGLRAGEHGVELRLEDQDDELLARSLVNSAGLAAPGLARQLDDKAPDAHFARGHYFSYSGRPPFSRLVYPVAEPGGLGVHVTLDLAGQVKFGPDVEWCDDVDYRFDAARKPAFAAAIRRYFPALEEARLQPDYVGVRPKISARGEAAADFRIDGPESHGVPGLVNLLGIESPGLTASLAIAERVTETLAADRE